MAPLGPRRVQKAAWPDFQGAGWHGPQSNIIIPSPSKSNQQALTSNTFSTQGRPGCKTGARTPSLLTHLNPPNPLAHALPIHAPKGPDPTMFSPKTHHGEPIHHHGTDFQTVIGWPAADGAARSSEGSFCSCPANPCPTSRPRPRGRISADHPPQICPLGAPEGSKRRPGPISGTNYST